MTLWHCDTVPLWHWSVRCDTVRDVCRWSLRSCAVSVTTRAVLAPDMKWWDSRPTGPSPSSTSPPTRRSSSCWQGRPSQGRGTGVLTVRRSTTTSLPNTRDTDTSSGQWPILWVLWTWGPTRTTQSTSPLWPSPGLNPAKVIIMVEGGGPHSSWFISSPGDLPNDRADLSSPIWSVEI